MKKATSVGGGLHVRPLGEPLPPGHAAEAMKRGRGRPCGPPTDVVRTTLDDGASEGARVPRVDSELLAKRASELGLKKGPLIGALIRVFLVDHEAAAVILESSAWPRK